MRARVLGFGRNVNWSDDPPYVLRLNVAGDLVDLPVTEQTFNEVYRDYIETSKGPDAETRVFTPPSQLEVDIVIRRAT